MPTEEKPLDAQEETSEVSHDAGALKVLGWLSVGVAVAALGVFVGRKVCSRYKFNHRTPYDFYAHADEDPCEFGVGI
jgi:hypothetical protein